MSQDSNHVPMESDDELDQLISDGVQTSAKPATEFTFVNEFTSEDVSAVQPASKKGRKRKIEAASKPETSSKTVTKKAKTRQGVRNKLAVFENNDDDEEPQALSVRAYLHLETTSQQPSRGKKPAAIITKSSQCNPFIFTIDTSFNMFIRAVADAAKTTTMNLTVSRLRWKFETPASLPMKLLTDEVGFRAMLDAVQERTKGHTIFLFLPKPIDLEAPPEVTVSSHRNNTMYEDDEDSGIPADRTAFSHKAQINHLRQENSKEVTELEHRYPIGDHPLFPNKRIYTKGGLFWDLTPLRLDVWAAAIRQSTHANPRATYDAPPMSNHFTKDKAIKPTRPPPDAPMTTFAAYGAYHKGEDYMPTTDSRDRFHSTLDDYRHDQHSSAISDHNTSGHFTHARPGSMPDPSLFPRLPGLHPPAPYYHPTYFPYQYPYFPPPNVIQPQQPLAPQAPAPASVTEPESYPSPGVTMKHSVTLEAFCARYLISSADSEKLSQLEYRPGNRIVESLTTGDWQLAGFTVLSWRTFLSHHRKFCDAIIAGTWV
ncbi:hypothetical protein DEU56DRAFT_750243 [Suillus clintonianus]|uniref:uncharacterized protein n=1 Tax=Suillus clintonianus TaxID=1904413 RepID=UPI001B88076C|nr:uncharacterized protein DEU56DRAFT_750243 [Suillus clintonianus]KAG2157039.1 hypothetical protein DEU56DRAFT_750243 [Suillus clintonianus]